MDYLEQIYVFFSTRKGLFTIGLVALILVLRKLVLNKIRGEADFVSEDQRKWMSRTKNGSFALVLITIFILWKAEISEFALSVTAIAVAIVVASKEIILCVTGSIQRASSRSFRIGDWIEVGSVCGEVIEHNMMATVLQEIDLHSGEYNYTGKTTTLPNSLFFTHPVKNLNFMKRYVFHHFTIVVPEFHNLYPMMPSLVEKIDNHCLDFLEVARRYNTIIEKRAGVDLPGSEPRVSIGSVNTGEQLVHIKLFCPTERAGELEQFVRADFMELYHATYSNN